MMKATSLWQVSARLLAGIGLTAAASLLPLTGNAQSVWDTAEVRGKSAVYRCEKNMKRIFIRNSASSDPRKDRVMYDPEKFEYSYVRLVSHDAVLNAFRRVFPEDEVRKLAELKENITIFVDVGERGQILDIRFSINEGSIITPTSIELLEKELRESMRFEVIGKKLDYPVFYYSPFRVNFTEVEKGEIRTVRNSVNLKAPFF